MLRTIALSMRRMLAMLILVTPLLGQSGPPSGYGFYRAITIDHNQVPNTDQTDFPVLVAGTFSYLATVANGGKVVNPNGYDIVFTDATGTQFLNWEIESYDPMSGTIAFWVRAPTLSHTADTVLYMYYGNSAISAFQGGSTGSVWDSNYLAVYHLNLDPTISGAKDSTVNGAI